MKNLNAKSKGMACMVINTKNLVLDAGNSGTTARLLCSILIDAHYPTKITGDESLVKRDMNRIIQP